MRVVVLGQRREIFGRGVRTHHYFVYVAVRFALIIGGNTMSENDGRTQLRRLDKK